MRLNILSFVFIVFWQVSVAQVSVTNNNLQSNNNCPLMEVSISSNNNSGIIEVSYCNHGNAIAVDAYVEIEVTNDLLITQATIPVSSVVNKKYTFDLGDVNSLNCGAFYIEIPNVDKRVHCTNVRIFPDDPCQGMIDQYIIDRTGADEGDDDDNNGSGINAGTATFSEELYHSAPGVPLLGQGGGNSVFEDHVFLNNIPSWDSLLSVLTNSGVLPNVTNTSTSGTASTMNGLNDITTLVSAELCSSNSGGTVVLIDVVTETRGLDRTVDNSQGTSNGTTATTTTDEVTTTTDRYENKEVAVRLYPNPFSTTATITIDGANYQQITLEVLDIAGKSIQSLQVNKQQSITLHRETLSQGVYFYRLIGDNLAFHTGKFVIR